MQAPRCVDRERPLPRLHRPLCLGADIRRLRQAQCGPQELTCCVDRGSRLAYWISTVLKNSVPVGFVTYPFTRFEKASGGSEFAMKMRATSSWIICSAWR